MLNTIVWKRSISKPKRVLNANSSLYSEDAMSRALVNGLRARGVDLKTVSEMDTRKLADEAQLKFAASQGRVLYTSNISDFSRLHAEYMNEGKSHAGIIFVPQQRYGFGEQIRRF